MNNTVLLNVVDLRQVERDGYKKELRCIVPLDIPDESAQIKPLKMTSVFFRLQPRNLICQRILALQKGGFEPSHSLDDVLQDFATVTSSNGT